MKVSNFRNYFLSVKSSRVVKKGDAQRTGLYAGWELVFRLPTTAAD
jgi:hypothetical protein